MTQQLFIPDKIKVGYQKRSDTYTGKLAYVIYYDKQGKLRKEKSWKSWCREKVSHEFENEPTEGFVLNKGVGGARASYGWNTRNEYIRVYDPRDFEFEISVANLLFILRECDCSRGKGLEGKFVYAWEGTQLVLLPTSAEDYQASQNFSELQGKKISAKDLIKGATYITKNNEEYIYLGRFDRYRPVIGSGYYNDTEAPDIKKAKDRRHVFYDPNYKKYTRFYFPNSIPNTFAVCTNEEAPANYAFLVDSYMKSVFGSPVVKLDLIDPPSDFKTIVDDEWRAPVLAYKKKGELFRYHWSYIRYHDPNSPKYVIYDGDVNLQSGTLSFNNNNNYTYSYPKGFPKEDKKKTAGYYSYGHLRTEVKELPWPNPKPKLLVAVLESGAKFIVDRYGIGKKVEEKEQDED